MCNERRGERGGCYQESRRVSVIDKIKTCSKKNILMSPAMQWRMKNTWEPDCEIGLDNILILRLTGESWLTIQQSGLAEYKFGLNNPWLRYWPSFCLSSKSPISILPTIILTVSWEVLANIFSTGCLLTCRTIWQYDSKQMWCYRASYSACVPTWHLHQHPRPHISISGYNGHHCHCTLTSSQTIA